MAYAQEITLKFFCTPGSSYTLSVNNGTGFRPVDCDSFAEADPEILVNGQPVTTVKSYDYGIASAIIDQGLANTPPDMLGTLMHPFLIDVGPAVYQGMIDALTSGLFKDSMKGMLEESIAPVMDKLNVITNMINPSTVDVSSDSGVGRESPIERKQPLALKDISHVTVSDDESDSKYTSKIGLGVDELFSGTMFGHLPGIEGFKLTTDSNLNTQVLRYDRADRIGVECVKISAVNNEQNWCGMFEHVCDYLIQIGVGVVQFVSIYIDRYMVDFEEYALYAKTIFTTADSGKVHNCFTLIASTFNYHNLHYDPRMCSLDFKPDGLGPTINFQHAIDTQVPKFGAFLASLKIVKPSNNVTDGHWLDNLTRRLVDFPRYKVEEGDISAVLSNLNRILELANFQGDLVSRMKSTMQRWLRYRTEYPQFLGGIFWTECLKRDPVFLEFDGLIEDLFSNFCITGTSPSFLAKIHSSKMRKDGRLKCFGKVRFGELDGGACHFCPCCGTGFTNILMTQICNDLDHLFGNYFVGRNFVNGMDSEPFVIHGEWKGQNMKISPRWNIKQGMLAIQRETSWKNHVFSVRGRRLVLS